MLEVLQFVFSSFWIWLGSLVMLCTIASITTAVLGIVTRSRTLSSGLSRRFYLMTDAMDKETDEQRQARWDRQRPILKLMLELGCFGHEVCKHPPCECAQKIMDASIEQIITGDKDGHR